MSLLFTSFGTVFGLIALLIIGASGFTAESFALAVIVMVVGLLLSLFVMDSLQPNERSKSRRASIRKAQKHLEKHGWKWALGLSAVAALALYLGSAQNPSEATEPTHSGTLASSPATAPMLTLATQLPTESSTINHAVHSPSEGVETETTAAGAAAKTTTAALPSTVTSEVPALAPALASAGAITETAQPASANGAADAVAAAIETWRQAWEKRDIDTYLAAYAPDFKPSGGLPLAAWRAQRRDRVGRARDIHIVLEMQEVTVNGDRASARFRQRYSAAHITDSMRKQLLLTRTTDGWRIVEEKEDGAS